MASGEIQDLLTTKNDNFWPGAIDFDENTVIENNDIVILENVEALWQGIVGVLHTPKGAIDGVGLEKYGSQLLSLRGMNLTPEIKELAKMYIQDTVPQYQNKVRKFTKIIITNPSSKQPYDKLGRFSMKIELEVDSVYGRFNRTTYI